MSKRSFETPEKTAKKFSGEDYHSHNIPNWKEERYHHPVGTWAKYDVL
jgi:hypothetical protein